VKDSRQQSAFRTFPRPLRCERAFSLYEALVTLTVVSTVSTVAIPAFQQLTSSQRISGAVNALVSALHLARSEAIKHSERVALCPSANGRTCHTGDAGGVVWEEGYLLYIDRNGNHKIDTDESTVRLFGASEGLHIRSTPGRNHVTYQPSGMTPASNLTITICDKHGRGAPRSVIVSSSGRVRTSTRAADGSTIVCPTAS
jgi:type IV fimbrial biogenesis protein FimT